MSYKSKTFDILKNSGLSWTHVEITAAIPGSCGETISRALRRLFEQGCVAKRPKDPTKLNGLKLWTVVPTAVFPVRGKASAPVQTTQPQKILKGGSGKVTTMCLPQNKPTLVTATIQAITELVDAKQKFSAHDVTKKLREMVKDDKAKVDPTETGTVHAYGKTLPRIEHDDVKGIVHEYFDARKMLGWTRTMDGGHWMYSEIVVQPIVANNPPPVVLLVPASDYTGDPTL